MVLRRISSCRGRLPRVKRNYGAKWRTANQIALPNCLLYPRVEVQQQTHSGDEIGELRRHLPGKSRKKFPLLVNKEYVADIQK